MKKISQNQMKMLEDVLKTTLREALSEEIDALFAARIAAFDDMAKEKEESTAQDTTAEISEFSEIPDPSDSSENSDSSDSSDSQLSSALSAFFSQAGLSEEEEALVEPVVREASDLIEEGRTADLLPLLARAALYDKAVERADAEGELRGRNAAVEIALKRLNTSDGIPATPSANIPSDGNSGSQSIFSLARMAREG